MAQITYLIGGITCCECFKKFIVKKIFLFSKLGDLSFYLDSTN